MKINLENRLIDSHNRTIDYLRISVTDRCNLRCVYCMPEKGVDLKPFHEILTYEELVRFARIAVDAGIKKIRLTGGEPLVRKGLVGLVGELAKIEGLKDLALTTNGILLTKHARELKAAGLRRVNISMDSLDPETYKKMTRGGDVGQVLAGMKAAVAAGLEPVKLNVVVNRDIRPELEQMLRLVYDFPVHVRFIERMPFNQDSGENLLTCADIMEAIMNLAEVESASGPKGSGPARYFTIEGAAGTVGFICPNSRHICDSCNRLRLTADGKLRMCLFSEEEIDIRSVIRSDASDIEILAAINQALARKPEARRRWKDDEAHRRMHEIGG